jgi:hypothetical protein
VEAGAPCGASTATLHERAAMMQFQLAGLGMEARALVHARHSSRGPVSDALETANQVRKGPEKESLLID